MNRTARKLRDRSGPREQPGWVDGPCRARSPPPWWPAGWWCGLRWMLEPGKVRPLSGLPHIQAYRLSGDERTPQALWKRRPPVAEPGPEAMAVSSVFLFVSRPPSGFPRDHESRVMPGRRSMPAGGAGLWPRDSDVAMVAYRENITSSIAARTWAPASTDIVICEAIAGANIFPQPLRRGPRQRRRARSRPRKAINQVRKQPRSNAMLGVDIDYQAIGKREGSLIQRLKTTVNIEFSDFVAVFEALGDEARSLQVIDRSRSLAPDKPIRWVIASHPHFDHVGGLRTYLHVVNRHRQRDANRGWLANDSDSSASESGEQWESTRQSASRGNWGPMMGCRPWIRWPERARGGCCWRPWRPSSSTSRRTPMCAARTGDGTMHVRAPRVNDQRWATTASGRGRGRDGQGRPSSRALRSAPSSRALLRSGRGAPESRTCNCADRGSDVRTHEAGPACMVIRPECACHNRAADPCAYYSADVDVAARPPRRRRVLQLDDGRGEAIDVRDVRERLALEREGDHEHQNGHGRRVVHRSQALFTRSSAAASAAGSAVRA